MLVRHKQTKLNGLVKVKRLPRQLNIHRNRDSWWLSRLILSSRSFRTLLWFSLHLMPWHVKSVLYWWPSYWVLFMLHVLLIFFLKEAVIVNTDYCWCCMSIFSWWKSSWNKFKFLVSSFLNVYSTKTWQNALLHDG